MQFAQFYHFYFTEKKLMTFSHIARVWQTDRRTERPWQYRGLHYIAVAQ